MVDRTCRSCGTCCTAPDIAALGKPLRAPCPHLDSELRCSIYDKRPGVCRGYLPDEICEMISAPTLGERVEKYLELFGMK